MFNKYIVVLIVIILLVLWYTSYSQEPFYVTRYPLFPTNQKEPCGFPGKFSDFMGNNAGNVWDDYKYVNKTGPRICS